MQTKEIKRLLIIALKLLIICSVVAVIVASVNFITKDKIAYNSLISTASALSEIYGIDFVVKDKDFISESDDGSITVCSRVDKEFSGSITGIYELSGTNGTSGYCVSASPMGFKASINLLIAINPNLTVREVKVVSLSETSGIGTKIQNPDFLMKFMNKTSPVSESVDTISGATKSSKPVILAVDEALGAVALHINSKEASQSEQ